MIARFFLNNYHSNTVIIKQDPHFAEKTETDERERLDAAHEAMNAAEL